MQKFVKRNPLVTSHLSKLFKLCFLALDDTINYIKFLLADIFKIS